MKINRFTLDNGLRVVHVHDRSTAMVAVNTLYDVGARDESPALTGIAHLFEHLMFGGSAHVPDFDAALSAAGGISNAWTSSDFTNFYDVLPAANIETALWIESDRMLRLALSERSLEVQRNVVIEEFKQTCLNRPYGDMDHALRALCYRTHPYRFPVIGKDFSHIERVTLADAERWFYSHYAPDNAVLAICGNIDATTAERLVRKWYGDLPPRKVASRRLPAEPLPAAPRTTTVSGRVPQTALAIAYPMAGYGTPEYFNADIISDILANGHASRFYRELLMGTDIFTEVDAAIQGTEEPGLFLINAKLARNGEEAEREAIAAIDAQTSRMARESVGKRDVELCLNQLESARTFGLLNYLSVAQTIALAEMHREDANRFMEPYRVITPDTLRSTAATIFNPDHKCTLIYRPEGAESVQ